jgi:hypothetical protein
MDGQPLVSPPVEKGGNAFFYCMLNAQKSGCDCEVCRILREETDKMMSAMKPEVKHGTAKRRGQ